MTNQAQAHDNTQLVDEDQVNEYLKSHPDFFIKNSALLADLKIAHESGTAISLIERQLSVLREKNRHLESRLKDLMSAARSNQRLNDSLQQLAINLFITDSLDDVIATVVEELKNKLETDFISIRFITGDSKKIKQQPERYISQKSKELGLFSKLLEDKQIQCGRLSEEQVSFLFSEDAAEVESGAVIPLADTEVFGLLALGGRDAQRYHPGMGTEYLQKLAELVSAVIKRFLD
ncbi:MAG: DUF484 family protein [Gammaproteobacteria bacterium]|nr:DUF484 family protein [Gammaproteobacteria bacterium]